MQVSSIYYTRFFTPQWISVTEAQKPMNKCMKAFSIGLKIEEFVHVTFPLFTNLLTNYDKWPVMLIATEVEANMAKTKDVLWKITNFRSLQKFFMPIYSKNVFSACLSHAIFTMFSQRFLKKIPWENHVLCEISKNLVLWKLCDTSFSQPLFTRFWIHKENVGWNSELSERIMIKLGNS